MKSKIISVSPRKNIQQVVYQNELPNGKKDSITRHEPLNPDKPHYRRSFKKEYFNR